MVPQIKIKINKVPEDELQPSEDEHKFTQLRGLVGEGPLREKLRKTLEDEPQVYSIKKTCGSEFEDMQKAARSVPLQFPCHVSHNSFRFPRGISSNRPPGATSHLPRTVVTGPHL